MSYPAKHIRLNNANNYFYYTNPLHKHGFYNITHNKKYIIIESFIAKVELLVDLPLVNDS